MFLDELLQVNMCFLKVKYESVCVCVCVIANPVDSLI